MSDPFTLLGKPSEWGAFGSGDQDAACDAERRAMFDHLMRRLGKATKRGADEPDAIANIVSGGATGLAGMLVASGGGPDGLKPDAYDHWIAICTFAWYQAIGIFDQTTGPQ